MVVLLQGDDGLMPAVDVDELGFRIGGRDVREAGEFDPSQRPFGGLALELDRPQEPRRRLRQPALDAVEDHLLVALVLDHDRGETTAGVDRHRVRLTFEVKGRNGGARLDVTKTGLDVEDAQLARRRGEARRRVDRDQRVGPGHADGGRLAVDRDGAGGTRCGRVLDADEADPAREAVAVDERPAIAGGGDDLGRSRLDLLAIAAGVLADEEGRDALEAVPLLALAAVAVVGPAGAGLERDGEAEPEAQPCGPHQMSRAHVSPCSELRLPMDACPCDHLA